MTTIDSRVSLHQDKSPEILNDDPHPILVISSDSQIIYSNPAFDLLSPKPEETDSSTKSSSLSNTKCFGGDESFNELLEKCRQEGRTQTTVSLNVNEQPLLVKWTALKGKEGDFRFYGNIEDLDDPVTGLFNRAYLEAEIKRNDTLRQLPISVLFVDADGLKKVNDLYGHYLGDAYLFLIAQVLLYSLREDDILGRWGGDEYLVILPKTDTKDTKIIDSRVKNTLKELNQFLSGDVSYEDLSPKIKLIVDNAQAKPGFEEIASVSFTIGTHTKEFGSSQSLRDIIANADKKMLEDKGKGGITPEELEERWKLITGQ